MWGYIEGFNPCGLSSLVPSLYVRVYRRVFAIGGRVFCSLIICEGISAKASDLMQVGGFPHYMWGYIVARSAIVNCRSVPSLYVRVYRFLWYISLPEASSLIICEGISNRTFAGLRTDWFPHYMWGYIGAEWSWQIIYFVPSLYVRVYHFSSRFMYIDICSLIICEGISAHREQTPGQG